MYRSKYLSLLLQFQLLLISVPHVFSLSITTTKNQISSPSLVLHQNTLLAQTKNIHKIQHYETHFSASSGRRRHYFYQNHHQKQKHRLYLSPSSLTGAATAAVTSAILGSSSPASAATAASASSSGVFGTLLSSILLKMKSLSILALIPKDNQFYVLSSVLVLSTFGIVLEKKSTIGKALSAPLATMALALVVANLGLMPFTSPVYDFINRFLIPLAIPLLLFDSNLRRVMTDTGTLLFAFIIGSFSTVISTILTCKVIPLTFLGENGWKITSALAARHIGGAINFVAVCETLNVSDASLVSAAIAADNVVVALYFAFLFYLAKPGEDDDEKGSDTASTSSSRTNDGNQNSDIENGTDMVKGDIDQENDDMSMQSISVSIAVASCLVTIGKLITTSMLPAGTSALPIISIVTVLSATLFSRFFNNIRSTGSSIGIIFMQMFFAASGAAGSIRLVIESAPSLFLFSALQIALHFISLMGIGRFLFKLQSKELYLASNANVGGPTTAAAMATAKEWKRLTLPALLVGILGYATATPIALLVGKIVLKLYS